MNMKVPAPILLLLPALFIICLVDAADSSSSSGGGGRGSGGSGEPGTDFRYYRENNTNSVETLAGGVVARTWVGASNGTFTHVAFGSPTLVRLDFSSKATAFPTGGDQFFLSDNAYFVVVSGNATFGSSSSSSDGEEKVYSYGDMLFVTGGTNVGPITSVGSAGEPLVLFVVTGNWDPVVGAEDPSLSPAAQASWTTTRGYRRAEGTYANNPDWPDGTVQNMQFPAQNNTPAALRVLWDPDRYIGYHYHPLGALYFVLFGSMYFDGDFEDYSPSVFPGEVRWVRPGFAYGPEYNGDESMEILVLGVEDNPVFGTDPPDPFLVQQPVYVTHTF